jgi:uncharacterized protein (TIGR03437 family)
MRKRLFVLPLLCLRSVISALAAPADDQLVNGKYFFRQVMVIANNPFGTPNAKSLIGSITFDGKGGYRFDAQENVGNNPPVPLTGSGTYSMNPAFVMVMSDPLRDGQLNARFGNQAIIAAATEAASDVFEIFVAITVQPGAGLYPYNVAVLEFPFTSVRSTFFNVEIADAVRLRDIEVKGRAEWLGKGIVTQRISGATYIAKDDGTGSITFPPGGGDKLLTGTKIIYRNGAMILGGTTAPGVHDLLFGVSAGQSNFPNEFMFPEYWTAGLRFQNGQFRSYAGSARNDGPGRFALSKRVHQQPRNLDYTGVMDFFLQSDRIGTADNGTVLLAGTSTGFLGTALTDADAGAYELFVGISSMGPVAGFYAGGILNAASSAPGDTPLAPGEFATIYLRGTADNTPGVVASPPFPTTLDRSQVIVNDVAAQMAYINVRQINFIVPSSTTGPVARIHLDRWGIGDTPNIEFPLAATSPGVFTLDMTGYGTAVARRADHTLLTPQNPAKPGEIIEIFATGLGAVSPSPADPSGEPACITTPTVWIGRQPSDVLSCRIAPGYGAGVYEVKLKVPSTLQQGASYRIAIQTEDAYHEQAEIAVGH